MSMQLNSVGLGFPDPASLYRKEDEQNAEAAESRRGVSPKGSDADQQEQAPAFRVRSNATYRKALSGYDVTNIRPEELGQLIRNIDQAGMLPPEELTELARIRGELEQESPDSERSVNLLDRYMDQLEAIGEPPFLQMSMPNPISKESVGQDPNSPQNGSADGTRNNGRKILSGSQTDLPGSERSYSEVTRQRFNLIHKIAILQSSPHMMGVDTVV